MGKQVFVSFELKLYEIKSLTPYDKQHLLNHTNAWIDQNTKDIQSTKSVIIPSLLCLLGVLLLCLMTSTVFYVYLPFVYALSIISAVMLTLALINSRYLRLLQIRHTKQGISTMGTALKPIRFYFLKDHIKQLLTPQTQTLINASKSVDVRNHAIQALLYAGFAILGYLLHVVYGRLDGGIYTHKIGFFSPQFVQLHVLLYYILVMPSVAFLILSIKKLNCIHTAISRQ